MITATQAARNHAAYTRKVRKFYRTALNAQVSAVVKALNKHTVAWVENNLQELVRNRPIEQAMQKAYMLTAEQSGQKQLDDLRAQIEVKAGIFDAAFYINGWRRVVRTFIREDSAERVNTISETTRKRIRTAIRRAIDGGALDQARQIQAELNSPDFNRDRSLRIARTETTTAASLGHQMAADSLSEHLNMAMGKKWVPVIDNRTRHAHRDMATYPQIAKDREFFVNGENLAFPGDPKGRADNVINCRCSVSYSVLRDANGRPLPADSPLAGVYASV